MDCYEEDQNEEEHEDDSSDKMVCYMTIFWGLEQ